MRAGSFVLGLIILGVGLGGLYGYIQLPSNVLTELSKSSMLSSSAQRASALPIFGSVIVQHGAAGLVFAVVSLLGFVLFLNGLRSGQTKLSIKQIRELGLAK